MPDERAITKIFEKIGRHDERLVSLELWRQAMERKSAKLTVVLAGGAITLLATLAAALILAGIGVGTS